MSSSTIEPYSTIVAAVCPDGKLNVVGTIPSLTTDGRARRTISFTIRNVASSSARPMTTSNMSRQRFRAARTISISRPPMMMGSVSAECDQKVLNEFQGPVRWAASVELAWSSALRNPAKRPRWVIASPITMRTAAIATSPTAATSTGAQTGLCVLLTARDATSSIGPGNGRSKALRGVNGTLPDRLASSRIPSLYPRSPAGMRGSRVG